jgi:hypothetical protein
MRCRVTINVEVGLDKKLDVEPELVKYIEEFLIRNFKRNVRGNVTFQCSYDLKVFGNTYDEWSIFTQVVNGRLYMYTLDGFAQVSKVKADYAHEKVECFLKEIRRDKIIGIGGEALIYTDMYVENKECEVEIYTNSEGVYKNNLKNGGKCYLVDYRNFELKVDKPAVVVANVSRKGMRKELCEKLDNGFIRDIIGVYCSESYKKDLEYLKNYYIYKIENGELWIVYFKRISIVSLGNSCAVAYQLQKYGLRDERYVFDWIKYKKVGLLLDCLKDDFKGFLEFKDEREPKGVFPIIEDDEWGNQICSSIKINEYNMEFPHDKLDEDDIKKYRNRIVKFKSLKMDCVINCEVEAKELEMIMMLMPNMRKLIVVGKKQVIKYENLKCGNSKYEVLKIESKPKEHNILAWQKNHIDWLNIFLNV